MGNFEVIGFDESERTEAIPPTEELQTLPPEAKVKAVFAHPDDTILWASSTVPSIECYTRLPIEGDEFADRLTKGRKSMIDSNPFPNLEYLGLDEPVSFDGIDFDSFTIEDGEVVISDPELRDRYLHSRQEIITALRSRLAGVTDVLTHNPWGEYGHPDHINVYLAIQELQKEMQFRVWVTTHGAERSLKLANRYEPTENPEYLWVESDSERAMQIERNHKEHDCWTWIYDQHPYPNGNIFVNADSIRLGAEPSTHGVAEHPLIQQGVPSPFVGGLVEDADGDNIFRGSFQSFHPKIKY